MEQSGIHMYNIL